MVGTMKQLLLPSLVFCGSLAVLSAGDEPNPAPIPPPDLEGKDPALMAERLNELKTRHPERFKLIDVDGNGSISPDEAKAFSEKEKAARKAKMQEALDAAFTAADKNQDGTLDKAEFEVATGLLRDKVRDQMRERIKDRNKSGKGEDRPEDQGGAHQTPPAKPF
jgi:Ca2+-binding EF-hand superfamily protein